jgi:hypothetical protein
MNSRAAPRNAAPRADSRTSLGVRSMSFSPNRSSSRFNFMLIAACDVSSASAARVKLRKSATMTNACMASTSKVVILNIPTHYL